MMEPEPWMNDRIAAAERGENPTVILKMKSGYAVLGDYQHLPGYCVLIAVPRAQSLNGLSLEGRAQFTQDMMLIGDAIDAACKPAKLNYAVMMNLDCFLHGHIWARYAWEPDAYRMGPAWSYPGETRCDPEVYYTAAKNVALQAALKAALQKRLADIGYWEDA
ncbi:MAG TPA: hypothetical protein PK537_00265 [Candidatus Limiplasma sp.]|nr:hypothetical protein [Candidatus Limiplasma sp.]